MDSKPIGQEEALIVTIDAHCDSLVKPPAYNEQQELSEECLKVLAQGRAAAAAWTAARHVQRHHAMLFHSVLHVVTKAYLPYLQVQMAGRSSRRGSALMMPSPNTLGSSSWGR
jgi:hypothetical protein